MAASSRGQPKIETPTFVATVNRIADKTTKTPNTYPLYLTGVNPELPFSSPII